MKPKYELTFFGGAELKLRYLRVHRTFEDAEKEAVKVLSRLSRLGIRAAHPAIVYGPEFSQDGWTIR